MQLKSIKAYGFKSFADKIEIDIKDGITGIVGPNGSGKSNIVDAVKWVLGEQSVKALRGSKEMSDVIFQGSSSRKPLTRASVSLSFDNSDHYLNSDFKDIEIKRVVYSTGENEYSINNAKVRLKDITDLFLDSGAGKEAFSIISQGKIGEILNGKPEERRAIIEEAAGVLKYKKRKIESLKKLDKTKDNLSKIDLVINEISGNLEPLKEQALKAKKFLSFKEELESIEVSLLINDITVLNKEYEELKKNSDSLQEEIKEIDSNNAKDDAKEERLKLELIRLEEKINSTSRELLKVTEDISTLDANKRVITERRKYEVDDVKLANNMISLRENIMELSNNIKLLESELEEAEKKLQEYTLKKDELLNDYKKYMATKSSLTSEINLKDRLLSEVKNKIAIASSNIENENFTPYSVKSVLNNPRLKGICNTLGNLIEVKDSYSTAIDTILGFNQNVIVTNTEEDAKNAINYLKDNKLGRATFFPLNVIKPKYIDDLTLDKVKADTDFIDIASNLITYDTKYKNIVLNQLGNVIVVKNIDAMNRIGKLIGYSYRIVSIDGEILHTGGSITGGIKKDNRSTLNEKNNLEKYKRDLSRIQKDIDYNTEKLEKLNSEIELCNKNLNKIDSDIIGLKETIKNKTVIKEQIETNITSKESELKGAENMKSSAIDEELERTMAKYYEQVSKKEALSALLESMRTRKSELNTEISEIELANKRVNSSYNKKVNELNDIEVKLGKLDIKLDNLLIRLNDEYSMTYERAKATFDVPEDIENSRDRVQYLRKEMRNLGDVNTGSIDEFERINTRYEFLSSQKKDLQDSINNILEVINEMDSTMEKEFKDTFEKVNSEFKKVFAKLFKGGHGELILTEPLNILETGIDIIAEPPGKKLKNITLLSGGEKTLTAIALLFAVLNVKVVPFCILDEVEAALDEANVDMFGSYLKDYEHKTQFIVITHKKKTMEYANTLYGITMQESGVSKLVSVKLEGID